MAEQDRVQQILHNVPQHTAPVPPGTLPESGEGQEGETSEELDALSGNEDEIGSESEEQGEPAADASGYDESETDEGDTGEDEEEQEASTDDDLPAEAAEWKRKAEEAEERRRSFQSERDQLQNLLNQTIEHARALENRQDGGQGEQGPLSYEQAATQLGLDPEDVPTAKQHSQIQELVEQSKQGAQQSRQVEQHHENVRRILRAKPDVQDVVQFYQDNNMAEDGEHVTLSELGNYYRAQSAMKDKQITELQERLKKATQPGGDGTKKRRAPSKKGKDDVPPTPGGRNKRETRIQPGQSGFADDIIRRAKHLGQL